MNDKDPHSWAVQAYKLAVDQIYPFVATSRQITDKFQDEMRNLSRYQVALSGYRLALAIADLLDDK